MKVTKEQQENNIVKLTITVDGETFEKGVQKAYLKNVKSIMIPGFRKGKAPRSIIEKQYGAGVFYEDAINFVCPEAYENAVEETGIDPVSKPEIDIVEIGDGKDFVFSASVTVKPEVELGNYKEMSVKKVTYRTTQKEIDAEIKKAQEQNARIITVEDRPVKSGDLTTIDFEGFTDGVAFEGGKGTDYSLEIGSNTFIPGFEDQIIGAEIGKEFDVNVTFPKDYHVEDLKDKPAVFKVTVKEIKEKQLAEINDEFVKDVSEFDNLDEYKKSIKEKIAKSNEQKGKTETENAVIDEICKISKVDIPECMIENQLDTMEKDFDYRLSMQGLSLQKYLEMTGSDMKAFRDQSKDQAENQVKVSLIIEAVAKAENIVAEDSEIEAEMDKMAKSYKMELDKVKELFKGDSLKSLQQDIISRKAVDLLVKTATSK